MKSIFFASVNAATLRPENHKKDNMTKIGLIKEGKIPADNRVALTPAQCKWIHKNSDNVQIIVQNSSTRCFSDREFSMAGAELKDDVSDCDILLGIKEVPIEQL